MTDSVRFHFLCLLCLLWPWFSSCAKREPAASAQTLRISQRNEPATLDPHLATLPDEFFILRALNEGLVTPNPDGGTPLPGVAERWETSADGLTWTFHLRADARWSNGDPVTAQDFVNSARRALAPATAAPKSPLFFVLRQARDFLRGDLTDFARVGIAARAPHMLELTLEHATDDLLPLLASGPWLPVHQPTIERNGQQWTRPGNFVGNGPFVLAEWSPNQRIVVQRNPAYWDASAVKLDAVHFIAFDNGDTEERSFRAGQVDVTMAVPFSKLDLYRREARELLHIVPLHETRYLALNTAHRPLDDARVRRALSLALDRRTLVGKVVKGDQQPAHHFVPPGLGGYTPAAQIAENIAEARRLLAEAGFADGKGFPRLELVTWAGVGSLVSEAVQHRWRTELGINVSLTQREARTHLAALAAGDYDLAFVAAIPDYDSPLDLLQHYTTGDAANYPHWSNAEYDRLVARRELAAAEQVLLDEMPVIPLYFNSKSFLLRPAVRGWREDALWTRYYKHVYLDED